MCIYRYIRIYYIYYLHYVIYIYIYICIYPQKEAVAFLGAARGWAKGGVKGKGFVFSLTENFGGLF